MGTDLKQLVREQMEITRDIILKYPWHDPKCYGMWLAQTYYMVAHSTRLVALAGAYCPLEQNQLHARFVDHSKEERGHEKVCISDIKAIGYKLEDFPQTFQSASMYQIQYYWIQHRSPVSFFGYTLALECLAEYFGQQVYKMLCDAHGPKASVFMKLHSEDDIEHTEMAYKMLDLLTEPEKLLVKENLIVSCQIYRGMLNDARAWAERATLKKAV